MSGERESRPERPWLRGVVWIGVGAAVWVGSLAWGRPIVVRGTTLPWGAVVVGVGILLVIWDVVKARRRG